MPNEPLEPLAVNAAGPAREAAERIDSAHRAYQVILSRLRRRRWRSCRGAAQVRMASRLARLAAEPRGPGCVKLAGGSNAWRVRQGDYRAVYEIDDCRANGMGDDHRPPPGGVPGVVKTQER